MSSVREILIKDQLSNLSTILHTQLLSICSFINVNNNLLTIISSKQFVLNSLSLFKRWYLSLNKELLIWSLPSSPSLFHYVSLQSAETLSIKDSQGPHWAGNFSILSVLYRPLQCHSQSCGSWLLEAPQFTLPLFPWKSPP